MNAYIGVNNAAKSVSKIYVSVNGEAKNVVKGYVGDDSCMARLFFGGARPKIYTFAGRKVYRHETLPGSVVEYNEFGTDKKLFVPDAAYRGKAQWKTTNTAVSGLKQWNHTYSPTCTGNVIDSATGYVNLQSVADLTPYESKLTDAHFQSALTATLQPVLQTAKEATDFMIAEGNCPAATFCRSKSVGVELQLPNIYQLFVLFTMSDVIDKIDPTLADNPTYALGWNGGKNTYRWRLGGANNTWSSTEYSATYVSTLQTGGRTYGYLKNNTFGVAPVAEL